MPCHLNVGITVKIPSNQVLSCSDSLINFIGQHLKVNSRYQISEFEFLLEARNSKVAQSQILNLKEHDESTYHTTKTKVLYSLKLELKLNEHTSLNGDKSTKVPNTVILHETKVSHSVLVIQVNMVSAPFT